MPIQPIQKLSAQRWILPWIKPLIFIYRLI
jgi:hypothetical protein